MNTDELKVIEAFADMAIDGIESQCPSQAHTVLKNLKRVISVDPSWIEPFRCIYENAKQEQLHQPEIGNDEGKAF
jgi:hypothetical protein